MKFIMKSFNLIALFLMTFLYFSHAFAELKPLQTHLHVNLEGLDFQLNHQQGLLMSEVLVASHAIGKLNLHNLAIDLLREKGLFQLTHTQGSLAMRLPDSFNIWLGQLKEIKLEKANLGANQSLQFSSERIIFHHSKSLALNLANIILTCPELLLPDGYPLLEKNKNPLQVLNSQQWISYVEPLTTSCLKMAEISVGTLNISKAQKNSFEEDLIDEAVDKLSRSWLEKLGESPAVLNSVRSRLIPVILGAKVSIKENSIQGQASYRLLKRWTLFLSGKIDLNLSKNSVTLKNLRLSQGRIPLTRVVLTALKVLRLPYTSVNVIQREIQINWP